MAITVAFDGTRVNASDANTNWSKLNEGGGSPAAEAQLAYQNSLTVNNKCTSATSSGLEYDPGSGALDMTAAAYPLCFLKLNISDFGDLNATLGAIVYIGSSSSDYNIYNFAGTGAKRSVFNTWPAQGGYILSGLNPNVAAWEDATSPQGTPALGSVDYFAFQGSWIVGGAKSENLAFDAIDVGRGLIMTGNTPDGEFEDFQSSDEGTLTNRWGVVYSKNGILYCVGKLTVGSATATSFTDTGVVNMVFPDGYVDSGDLGELYDLQNASTDVFLSTSQLIGGGSATTAETRPSLTVTGTTGAFEADGMIRRNYEAITFTSVCDVHNVDIQQELLTQASCDLYDSTIRTTSLTSIACLQDPTFGETTDLYNCEFIQAGAGHAIEIDTAGDYDFNDLVFTGYGADTTDSAALDVTVATGTVNITVLGGSTPTFKKTAGSTVNLITGTVTVLVHAIDATDFTDVVGARVFLYAASGGDRHRDVSVSIARSGSTATVTHSSHGLSNGDKVWIAGASEQEYNGVFAISNVLASSYDYTVTGTPSTPETGATSTYVILDGDTDSNGEVKDTAFSYTSDQPIGGVVRKGTAVIRYRTGPIVGDIVSTGFSYTAVMIRDE